MGCETGTVKDIAESDDVRLLLIQKMNECVVRSVQYRGESVTLTRALFGHYLPPSRRFLSHPSSSTRYGICEPPNFYDAAMW
jgi:hypothetical protein